VERGGFQSSLRRRTGIALTVAAIAFAILAGASAVPSPPAAELRADDLTPFVGEPVRFDASASEGHDEGNGRIVAYRFDFGDGKGTDWQPSPFAVHAFSVPGPVTATVTVRDARDLRDRASVRLNVRSTQPPTGDAPDLSPVAATFEPARPATDDVVSLAITLVNRGGSTATSATIEVMDARPSGDVILIDRLTLAPPLVAGEIRTVITARFLAVEAGEHAIRIEVRDVAPAEPLTADNRLEVTLEVESATDGDGPSGGPGGLNPWAVVLVVAAFGSLAGAYVLLTRPREEGPLGPPPPKPSDRSPPPVWPP